FGANSRIPSANALVHLDFDAIAPFGAGFIREKAKAQFDSPGSGRGILAQTIADERLRRVASETTQIDVRTWRRYPSSGKCGPASLNEAPLRENVANAENPPAPGQSGSAAIRTALRADARPARQAFGLSRRRHRRVGGRPRSLPKAGGRDARAQWHGLYPGSASRPHPRKHVGGLARQSHRADGARSSRWNADRARTSLCHSAWNLSLRQPRHPSSLQAPSAPRCALAVRFSAPFAGGGLQGACRL